MTSKERTLKALAHESPDKTPVDFGSTPVTGIHVLAIEGLRKHFGFECQHSLEQGLAQMVPWAKEVLSCQAAS